MKIKKVDGRMNAHGDFEYVIPFRLSNRKEFIEIRNWCWQSWGPSCELEHWQRLKNQENINPAWSWSNQDFGMNIYLGDESKAAWYLLKWGT